VDIKGDLLFLLFFIFFVRRYFCETLPSSTDMIKLSGATSKFLVKPLFMVEKPL
jgi:hypothetical protein